MRKSLTVVLALVAVGAVACSSSSKSSSSTSTSTSSSPSTSTSPSATTAAATAKKTAYCAANDLIDRASASVTSNVGFLTVLKSHQTQIQVMLNNAPFGTIGQETRVVVRAARRAITSNNANLLNNIPNGGLVDTYCGVDGNGKPLPSYFATGKGTTFCKGFLPIYTAVGNATSPAAVLKVIVSYKTQVGHLATEVSSLPTSIRSEATATVKKAQTAIAQNSAASLNGNGNGPAQFVALYCGQNE
jgi:hypothetical protein